MPVKKAAPDILKPVSLKPENPAHQDYRSMMFSMVKKLAKTKRIKPSESTEKLPQPKTTITECFREAPKNPKQKVVSTLNEILGQRFDSESSKPFLPTMLSKKLANQQVTKLINCEKILDSMLPQETNLRLLTVACLASTYFCMKDVWRANRYLDYHELFIHN